MSRDLRERLERAQARVRTLSQAIEHAPSGPQPLPPETQRALDQLRAETLRLEREATPREAELASSRARREKAEQALLQQQAASSERKGETARAITGGVMLGFVCALRMGTSLFGPLPAAWVSVLVIGGAAGWLLRDAWHSGRVSAARFSPMTLPPR